MSCIYMDRHPIHYPWLHLTASCQPIFSPMAFFFSSTCRWRQQPSQRPETIRRCHVYRGLKYGWRLEIPHREGRCSGKYFCRSLQMLLCIQVEGVNRRRGVMSHSSNIYHWLHVPARSGSFLSLKYYMTRLNCFHS